MTVQLELFTPAASTVQAGSLTQAHVGRDIEIAGSWRAVTGIAKTRLGSIAIDGVNEHGTAECCVCPDLSVRVR